MGKLPGGPQHWTYQMVNNVNVYKVLHDVDDTRSELVDQQSYNFRQFLAYGKGSQ